MEKQVIKNFIAYLKSKGYVENQKDFGIKIGYKSESAFSQALNRLPDELYEKIKKVYPEFIEWVNNNEQPPKQNEIPKGELKPKTYSHTLEVRLVSNKAKAGWSEGFYNDEYLEKMPVITIEADANYRGKYMAFEVAGDSMEPDYMEGDIVICRKIQRHLWTGKLHIRDWDFVIAHGTQGIMLKEIAEHNVETGDILCRSINKNYPDFTLNLREVTYLYNVVEVRQKGKNKRWNRAKDFL